MVISGPVGRRKEHFQAPPADVLPTEKARFLAWANEEAGEPMLIKAGLAHLAVVDFDADHVLSSKQPSP